jgi:hypothetical protein
LKLAATASFSTPPAPDARHLIYNVESRITPGRLHPYFVNPSHLRVRRAALKLLSKIGDGLGRSFGYGLDGSVGKISDRPYDARRSRGAGREVAKADSLHSTPDYESPGYHH